MIFDLFLTKMAEDFICKNFFPTFILYKKINNSMRYLLLSLSAVLFFGLGSCNDKESVKTIRSMSASVKRNSADSSVTWNADAALVKAEIPFARSVRFIGSQYKTNPTSMDMFINNYRGIGTYNIYQGSALQTDSNSVSFTYLSRKFTSIKGTVNILEDNAEFYIGRFEFTASSLDDTLTVKNGSFTINK